MVGADERELHSWQNNQLSRRVSKAAGTRSTVSLRKPIFAIGFERASRYTVQRERERERNKGSKATLLKLLEKFLVRPTPPLFPSNSRDPTSNEAAPPYDPSAKGIDSCSVLCAITTTLEYKSTGPMETTETGFRAARSGGGDTYGTRFNRGTKKLAATTISMVDRFRAESLNFLLRHCRPFVRRYIYFLLLFLFLRDPAILSS